MKKLLILILAASFCLVPIVAQAGNTAVQLYLEIFTYEADPDDPGPAPDTVCVHSPGMRIGELQCYSAKLPFTFAVVPVHVGQLSVPTAQGWPLPAGPGGGFVGLAYGLTRSGTSATFLGFVTCPNFLQGPGTAPGACLASATTQCHDWHDHIGYTKYMSSSTLTATFFDITMNTDLGDVEVIDCQANLSPNTVVGRAQWGGTKSVTCGTDPTVVEETTWGKIKGLYR